MAFTPKQERNGTAIGGDGHNTAVPGPDATAEIVARIGSAVSQGTDHYSAAVFGVSTEAGVVDWETGVATAEMPGEA